MSSDASGQAKEKAQETKKTFFAKLADDGVVNPSGLSMFGFSAIFFAAVPITSWLAQPNGLLEKAVNGVVSSIAFIGSAGSTSTIAPAGKLAALSTLYIAVTYAITGAGSAAGTAAGNAGGRDNNHPRAQVANLRGLPLRLHSAHYNLMEMFPGFALTAALAQSLAPRDAVVQNLLGLHVLAKVFLFYPSYLLNLDAPRSLAHVLATGAVINVGLRLAKTPIV